ncbi:protein phosphatase 1 regulatory subunit 32 [Pseudoliparis swirei]|uniref:protein phosphatase 1 regulatory subunit 32 n=1 Tax=Pseudoliparis swirei TaxID=2059687 RepID=UPI0024BE8BC7|nr:protein phosphatase 1 regulatory subunit 32 [Pseudoliparis swirei]
MMDFSSHLGHASATGYTSNLRPAIFYRPSLDLSDNPSFGLLLSDSFMSQTKQHYQPHIRSDCTGPLPNIVNKSRDSGFHQPKSLPKTATVEEKTEYQRWFVPHRLTPSVSQSHVTVGRRGESGFTEGTDLYFNTFQEKGSCTVEPLQNHSSVMKRDFVPPPFLQDPETRPSKCSSHLSRETGFTRGAIAPFACPTSLLPSPRTKSNSITTKSIGKKEPSGALRNAPSNQTFPNTPFDRSHFNTHYKSMFCHDGEKSEPGHTCAGIISGKRDNSYSRREMDRFIFRG